MSRGSVSLEMVGERIGWEAPYRIIRTVNKSFREAARRLAVPAFSMCSKSPCRPCIRPRVPIETRRAVRGAPSPKVLSSPSRVVVSSCGVQYMIVEPGRTAIRRSGASFSRPMRPSPISLRRVASLLLFRHYHAKRRATPPAGVALWRGRRLDRPAEAPLPPPRLRVSSASGCRPRVTGASSAPWQLFCTRHPPAAADARSRGARRLKTRWWGVLCGGGSPLSFVLRRRDLSRQWRSAALLLLAHLVHHVERILGALCTALSRRRMPSPLDADRAVVEDLPMPPAAAAACAIARATPNRADTCVA